jgi:hypothetical protein
MKTSARNSKTQRSTVIMKTTIGNSRTQRTATTKEDASTASRGISDSLWTMAPVSSGKDPLEGTDTATSATIGGDAAGHTVTATITAAPRASATSRPVSREKKKLPVKAIVGSIVGGIFGVLFLVIVFRILQRQLYKYQERRRQHDGNIDVDGFLAGGRKGPKMTKVARFRTPLEMAEERAAREGTGGVRRFELA